LKGLAGRQVGFAQAVVEAALMTPYPSQVRAQGRSRISRDRAANQQLPAARQLCLCLRVVVSPRVICATELSAMCCLANSLQTLNVFRVFASLVVHKRFNVDDMRLAAKIVVSDTAAHAAVWLARGLNG